MTKKLKLMTIVGTRPELIKMSEIIKACDRYFENILVHTGQNYDFELNQIFYKDLGIREPDHYLNVVGENLGTTIGNVISKSYEIMKELTPEAVIVLGDTNSCLSVISAKRLKIPVFHLEAGNRCFDENLPEEINRRIVDIASDVNLCYSEHARRNLLAMGGDPARTFCVGSPMPEVIAKHIQEIQESKICSTLGLEEKEYFLLSAHREENVDNENNFRLMMNSINALAEEFKKPILYSMHPRTKHYIQARGTKFHPLVISHKPFGFTDYNKLQLKSICVISDSGTLAEESSVLGFPAVSLRTSSERQEVVDAGIFTIGMLTADRLIQAVQTEIGLQSQRSKVIDYRDGLISHKIVKIIQSYVDYVNNRVWRK